MKTGFARFCTAVLFAVAFGSFARAADFYVDVATGDDTYAGTAAAPFKTIKAGVEAANTAGGNATVHVKGYANPTDEQTYKIDSGDDLMTVAAPNVTIQAWGWTANDPFSGVADSFEKPLVKLNENLNSITNNPTVITIAAGADYCTVRGLKFEHSSVKGGKFSLGLSGAIIRAIADYCTVDDCEFNQIGTGTIHGDQAVPALICSGSTNGNAETDEGQYLTVTGCRITGFIMYWDSDPTNLRRTKEAPIFSGKNALISKNIFDGSNYKWLFPRLNSPVSFISNRVVNCFGVMNSSYAGGSDGYSNVEIAHNIFITTNSNDALIEKMNEGMKNVFKFHHNTVSGYKTIFHLNKGGWAPTVYDNILLVPDGGTVLKETEGQFLAAGVFTGNAWYVTTGFATGTKSLTNLGGLDTIVANNNPNIALPGADDWVTIAAADVASPDYYRPYGNRLVWVEKFASADAAHAPAYIGAQEPEVSLESAIILNSVSVSSEETEPDQALNFTVDFKLENFADGSLATVEWDFDGNGTIDRKDENVSDAEALTVSYAYAKHGKYYPTVTVSAEGVEPVSAGLTSGHAIKLRRSEIYVKATAATGGDGSRETPFSSLEVALALCQPNAQVYVYGGETDGVYTIADADDLMTVDKPGVTIQPWDGTGTPTVAIADDLRSKVGKLVYVMTIASGADHCTIKGLAFTYSSDGVGTDGRLISIDGQYPVIENCSFTQTGGSARLESMIHCNVYEGNRVNGRYLIVRGCSFKGITSDRAVYAHHNAQIVGNVYEDCSRCFTTYKQAEGGYFVSNRVVNCTKGLTSAGPANYDETPSAEIAYNVFVGGSETLAFFTKTYRGMNGAKIHHNTVVGLGRFVMTREVMAIKSDNQVVNWGWTPEIFDNLIVLSGEDSAVIREEKNSNANTDLATERSTFNTGAFFRNNAWWASKLVANTYDEGVTMNLTVENNIRLGSAPAASAFVDTTDPWSPDFYRPKMSKNPTWTGKGFAWTGTGEEGAPVYPDYIGAVEPLKPSGFLILVR